MTWKLRANPGNDPVTITRVERRVVEGLVAEHRSLRGGNVQRTSGPDRLEVEYCVDVRDELSWDAAREAQRHPVVLLSPDGGAVIVGRAELVAVAYVKEVDGVRRASEVRLRARVQEELPTWPA